MDKKDIKDILVETSYMSPVQADFIYDYIVKLPVKGRLLELGTGLGHSTVFFASVKPEWKIYTVDAYGSAGVEPLIYGLDEGKVNGKWVQDVYDYIHKHKITNVIQILSSFTELNWELNLDCLYIDGSHDYESIEADFNKFSPFVKKSGIIILDDYNNNWGVKRFVDQELLKDWNIESTTVTAILKRK